MRALFVSNVVAALLVLIEHGRTFAHHVFPRGLRCHDHLMLHAHLASISCMAPHWNSWGRSQFSLVDCFRVCWQAALFVAVSRCLRYFCFEFGDVLGGESDFDDGVAVDVPVFCCMHAMQLDDARKVT